MSDDITPEDIAEFAALKAELLSHDDVQAGLDAQLNDMAERLVLEAVQVGRALKRLDDPLKAIRLMTEVTVWWVELKKQLEKEAPVLRRPKATVGSFNR